MKALKHVWLLSVFEMVMAELWSNSWYRYTSDLTIFYSTSGHTSSSMYTYWHQITFWSTLCYLCNVSLEPLRKSNLTETKVLVLLTELKFSNSYFSRTYSLEHKQRLAWEILLVGCLRYSSVFCPTYRPVSHTRTHNYSPTNKTNSMSLCACMHNYFVDPYNVSVPLPFRK